MTAEETGGLEDEASLGRIAVVVFLTAFALLNGQVSVTRLLSYPLFYHFVFFVVSLAQLGLAAAGVWVYVSGRRSWSRNHLAGWLVGVAVASVALLFTYGWLNPPSTLSNAKLHGPAAYRYLAQNAVPLVLFNLCGGMVLTIVFTACKPHIGRLYATDLFGAGLGCLASVGLMMALGPIRAFALSGVAGLVAAGLVVDARRLRLWLPVAALLGAGGLAAVLGLPSLFDPARRGRLQERTVRTEWNHIARTDAVRASCYVIDGDARTDLRKASAPAPSYALAAASPSVAVVGVGAGPQLLQARVHGASSVLAIDINPTILRWDREDDRDANGGLFHDPTVQVVEGDGRHELRASRRSFDLIVMHAIDTWTASSQGAYALSENFLYTSEALEDFLSRLTPGGVLSIRRWLFWPPRENMRLFTTALDVLKRRGAERPEQHIVLLSPTPQFRDPAGPTWGLLLISNQPLSEERLAPLDRKAQDLGWAYVHRPGRTIETPFAELLAATDREAFYRDYPYVVRPSTDRNPFFFQFIPPWSTRVRPILRHDTVVHGDSSSLLVLCFAVAAGLSVLLLGVPLFLRRREFLAEPQWAPSLAYFACLGLGFMAFELPVIQIMTLFLGHPTYALSVVLMGLLVSAGVGSHLMGRASLELGPKVLLGVALLGLLSSQLLLPLVHAAIELPDPARFAITLGYLALIGVPLGMPFVAGVRLLDPTRPAQVAWAWAVNGAAAVVGTTLLMILMVYAGSDVTLLVAAGCYALALVARRRLVPEAPEAPETPEATALPADSG